VEENVNKFIVHFASIVYEAFPFVVLGSVIAGFLEELVPQRLITRVLEFLRKHVPEPFLSYLAIGISALLGLVFPMCECGIIPVMRRLLRKGLPLSCCVAYILAGPIINPVVMMSTYYAFKKYPPTEMGEFWMVLLRCAMGYVVACITAIVVHSQFKKHGFSLLVPLAVPPEALEAARKEEMRTSGQPSESNADDEEEEKTTSRSITDRLGNISATALHDFIDIMVFLILGAVLASLLRLNMSQMNDVLPGLENIFLAVAFMMLMAILMCLCSEADAFVGANFPVPPAAKLSFLALGPMLDLKLYLMYTRVFRPRLIWTIISCVCVQVYVYSIIMNVVWQNVMIPWLGMGG
jgi:uncharacterized membrane protein YraQ (UPF0718 family)